MCKSIEVVLELVARFTVHNVLGELVVDTCEPEMERRMSAGWLPSNVSSSIRDGRYDLDRVHRRASRSGINGHKLQMSSWASPRMRLCRKPNIAISRRMLSGAISLSRKADLASSCISRRKLSSERSKGSNTVRVAW